MAQSIKATVDARKFFALAPFVSTEETRYYLTGVCVQPRPNGEPGNTLVATDGHTLGAFIDAEAGDWSSTDGEGEDQLIVKIDPDLKRAAERLLKTAAHVRLVIEQEPDKSASVTLQSTTMDDRTEFEPEMSKFKQSIEAATFPDWRRVVPAARPETDPRAVPAVNVTYVKRFEAIAKANNKSNPIVRLDPGTSAGDPVRVFTGDPDFIGVIMPVKYGIEGWNW